MKAVGSKSVKSDKEAIKRIGDLTSWYKKKRMSTDDYIKEVNIALAHLYNERNYIEYLSNIGQLK
jgi:hypothetical protein